jgi:hypothetical protein
MMFQLKGTTKNVVDIHSSIQPKRLDNHNY